MAYNMCMHATSSLVHSASHTPNKTLQLLLLCRVLLNCKLVIGKCTHHHAQRKLFHVPYLLYNVYVCCSIHGHHWKQN